MKPTVSHVFRIGVLVVLGLAETACQSENPAAPSPSVSFSVLDLEVGTGAEATIGSAATVNYSGWLYDAGGPENKGTLFDSSPGQGFSFVLGLGQVIVGWDQGIVGMRVGGTRRLIIPPDMAYGSRATGLIPPNSALVFDVELLAVQ